MIRTEPSFSFVSTGPNTALGRMVVNVVAPVFSGHELPSRTLREYLRQSIGVELPIARVSPDRLVADGVRALRGSSRTAADVMTTRFDPAFRRGAEDPQGALTRGSEQCIRIPRSAAAER